MCAAGAKATTAIGAAAGAARALGSSTLTRSDALGGALGGALIGGGAAFTNLFGSRPPDAPGGGTAAQQQHAQPEAALACSQHALSQLGAATDAAAAAAAAGPIRAPSGATREPSLSPARTPGLAPAAPAFDACRGEAVNPFVGAAAGAAPPTPSGTVSHAPSAGSPRVRRDAHFGAGGKPPAEQRREDSDRSAVSEVGSAAESLAGGGHAEPFGCESVPSETRAASATGAALVGSILGAAESARGSSAQQLSSGDAPSSS